MRGPRGGCERRGERSHTGRCGLLVWPGCHRNRRQAEVRVMNPKASRRSSDRLGCDRDLAQPVRQGPIGCDSSTSRICRLSCSKTEPFFLSDGTAGHRTRPTRAAPGRQSRARRRLRPRRGAARRTHAAAMIGPRGLLRCQLHAQNTHLPLCKEDRNEGDGWAVAHSATVSVRRRSTDGRVIGGRS